MDKAYFFCCCFFADNGTLRLAFLFLPLATKRVFGLPLATERRFEFRFLSLTVVSVLDSSSLELDDCSSMYLSSDDDKVMVLLL
jgi:hypothetical protein